MKSSLRYLATVALVSALIPLPQLALAQGPLTLSPVAQGAMEVIRPITGEVEVGDLVRLRSGGPARWTVYEPDNLAAVVESDTSILFAGPPNVKRVVVFACVVKDGVAEFQPYVIRVKGTVVPPNPPDPVDPTPKPPIPDPDDGVDVSKIPDAFGFGKNAYLWAKEVKSPNRAQEAKAIAKAFADSAADFSKEGANSSTLPIVTDNLKSRLKSAYGENSGAWLTWERKMFPAIIEWANRTKPSIHVWPTAFTEIQEAMEFVR